MIAGMVFLRLLVAGHFALPVGYGVPVILLALFRRRRLLWATTFIFALLSVIKFWVLLPEVPSGVHISARGYDFAQGLVVLLDLFLVTAMADLWLVSRRWLEKQNDDLETANTDLAAREEEIARQNEELQSQTEELERQGEELRVANEDLARREKTLEMLLSLARSLHTELSSDEMMERICQTLGLLVNGPGIATAILEQQEDRVVVRCHHGFGPQGVRERSIPMEQSFAALILAKGRTGYIEDLSLRPDLQVPQPVEGAPMAAILAAPLRVQGVPIGSLEVYARQKTSWSQEQVALVESLAAQTSVSLAASRLVQTISQERNRFEAVLRTAPVGIAVCNRDCSDIRLNPVGAALLNVPLDQNIATQMSGGLWPSFKDGQRLPLDLYPILRAARHGEEVHGEEIEMRPRGGRRIVTLTYARPIRDADGAPAGAVELFVDITAIKELQRELDVRRREAEEASQRKTRFLAAVSHDIRTPANAISLLAELIRRTASNAAMVADVPELAQELHDSAVSLVNLLGDVLDVARFDADKVELQETEFSLDDLLREEQKQLLPLARQKGLSLQFNPPAEPIVLRVDRIKLARIIGNLAGNAIKFTESGGVRIDVRNDNGAPEILVSDTGIGIAPEYLDHIFDEFFQLRNPERDRAKGSGLGLTICKRLVDAMGGQLAVRSTVGQGSTFTVTLPSGSVIRGAQAGG